MSVRRFVIVQPLPVQLYEDKPFLYRIIRDIWEHSLLDNGGIPLSGPLFFKRLDHGHIGQALLDVISAGGHIPVMIHGPAFNTLEEAS